MTAALDQIEELIASGALRHVHFGRSVMSRKGRFVTFNSGMECSVTGEGQTCEEALLDAIRSFNQEAGKAEVASRYTGKEKPPPEPASAAPSEDDILSSLLG